jgi:hypothetical protein
LVKEIERDFKPAEDKSGRIPTCSLSLEGEGWGVGEIKKYSLSLRRQGGQASSEDLLPLGYGERDRVRVRVKISKYIRHLLQ